MRPSQYLTDVDCVAVMGFMKCKAKATDKVFESDFIHLIKIKDNKIILFKEFFDTYAAGEAFRK